MKRTLKFVIPMVAAFSTQAIEPLPQQPGNELAAANHYSAYVFGDFSAGSGNANGALGVGGDLSIGGYSVATDGKTLTSGYGLVVEGRGHFSNGRLYGGKVRVQGEVDFSYAVLEGLPSGTEIENQPLASSISQTKAYYQDVSKQLSEAPINGSTEFKWGGLYLKGDCSSPNQVFNVDGAQLGRAHTFDVSCIPDNANVIFNITGESLIFQNKSLSTLIPHRENTIFNFHQANSIRTAGISIEGVVLAPNADIEAPHGDAQATVIAQSWTGSMHLGGVRFKGDLSDLVSFNEAPVIISEPPLQIVWPNDYSYAVVAEDADQDPISYTLLSAPEKATINQWTGLISWPVSEVEPGQYAFSVKASDDKGAFDTQDFVVTVNMPDNYAPEIISTPVLNAEIYTQYQYLVEAIDRDNDKLTFSLEQAPNGMMIDPVSGVIDWPVGADQTGQQLVVVSVTDGKVSDKQSFNIEVIAPNNEAPTITSTPVLETVVGEYYQYLATATDPNSDPLSFSLIEAPAGMQINAQTGLIDFVSDSAQLGTHTVTVKVTDAPGLSDTQSFQLSVVEQGNLAPIITSPAVNLVDEQQAYQYQVVATDDRDMVLNYSLTHAPQGMVIDPASGLITWPSVDLAPQGHMIENNYCRIVQDSTTRVSGAADVYLVVDESGSMSGEHRWMNDLVPALELGLQSAGVGNELSNLYGLVGYERNPDYKRFQDQLMVGAADFTQLSNQLRLYGGTEDGYHAMMSTLNDYPLRDKTAHNLILVTDEDRDVTRSISAEMMFNGLFESKVILNSVVNATFRCGDGTSAIGMTADGLGFVADGKGSYYTCTNTTAISGSGRTIDDYVHLAIASGGAAWDLNFLRSGGLRAQSFSKALVDIKVQEIIDQLPPILQADVQLNTLSLLETDNNNVTVNVELRNRGLEASLGDLSVVFYSDGQLLGQQPITALYPGEVQTVSLTGVNAQALGGHLSALVATATDECVSDNNVIKAAVARVKVADSVGASDSQWLAVNVSDINQAPVLAPVSPVTLEVGEAYSYALEVSEKDPGDGLSFSLIDGPATMAINESSGVLTWRPTQSDVGQFIATVGVVDLQGELASTQIEFNVSDFLRAPIIESSAVLEASVGASYYYHVIASSDRGANLTYKLVQAPKGMSINKETGEIVWRPDMPTKDGGHGVIVEVIDDKNLTAIQSFSVKVLASGAAPEFNSSPNTYLQLGSPFEYIVQVSTVDGHPAILTLTTAPAGMALDNVTNTVTWQPSASGVYTVAIKATSQGGVSITQSFDLQVADTQNLPPQITSTASFTKQADNSLVYRVAATDPESTALTYQLQEAPTGMVVSQTGVISWPAAEQVDGKHIVRIRVTDADGVFAEQAFSFSYYPSNGAPSINSTPLGVAAVDSQYIYQLTASDPDGDPVYFVLKTAPLGAVLDANNQVLWTPTASQLGTHNFEIVVEDALGAKSAQSFSVLVREILNNTAPQIQSAPSFSAFVGQSYQYQMIASDAEGHNIIYRLGSVPAGVSLSEQGLLTWTPSISQQGAQAFVVRAFDSFGAYSEQQYNVTVNAGDKPVITSTPVLSAYTDLPYQYRVAVTDLDGDSISYQLLTAPSGMSIDATGLITWSPTTQVLGVHPIEIHVNDPVGNTDTQQFNLTVKYQGNSLAPEIISEANTRAKTGEVYRYQVIAKDPDGDALSYQLGNTPSGVKIDSNGLLTWQPTDAQVGLHSLSVVVKDVTGKSVAQQFNVAVTAPGPFNRRVCR